MAYQSGQARCSFISFSSQERIRSRANGRGKCFETEEAPSQLPRGTSLDALPQSLEVAVQVCMNTGLFAKSSLLEHSGL